MDYLKLKDNRYMPFYACGDVLVLDNNNISDGNIVVVQTGTDYHLCKISHKNGETELLPPLSCCDREIAPGTAYTILGKVINLLRGIKQDIVSDKYYLATFTGDCMERHGITTKKGGYAVVCKDITNIRVGDIVHCVKKAEAEQTYIKEVKAINENHIIVGTAYFDKSKDFQFEADEIYSIVNEIYDKLFCVRAYSRDGVCKTSDIKTDFVILRA